MKSKLLVVLSSIALLSGCGNIKETTSNGNGNFQRPTGMSQGRVTQAGIDGTSWKTGCVVNIAKRTISSMEYTFQKDLLLSRTVNYSDEGCQTPTLEEERLSRVVITPDPADATKTSITETILTLKYRALTSIVNASLNEKTYCGVDTWVQSQFRFFASAADCGLKATTLAKAEIYGDQELHLDYCNPGETDCKVTLQRNASGI
jgi:uncharacterized protein YceK